MPDPNSWIVRDEKGRFASKGYRSPRGAYGGKTDAQRMQEYFKHTGRSSNGIPLGGPGSLGWQLVKNASNIKSDKLLALLFARQRGAKK